MAGRFFDAVRGYFADDARAMRALAAAACCAVTTSIGYAWTPHTTVDGWQLWAWLLCVVLVVAALMPTVRPPRPHPQYWPWLSLLLLLAFALRLPFLGSVPGGLHVDEMGTADFALRHVFPEAHSTINPFIPGPTSQPTLYYYLIRLSLAVLGNTIAGLRMTSALAGALAVVATYAVVAVFQERRTAILAAAAMTVYHAHIHWSRLALNNIWDTLWVPLMLACYAYGWKRRWSGGAVLAGLCVGLSQYFYAGARLGVLLLAITMLLLWRQERDGRRLAVHAGKVAAVAFCAAVPLAISAVRSPDAFFERARIVFGWQHAAIAQVTGEPVRLGAYAWHQAWRSIGAFTAVPDITGFYGPGVPLTIGLAAPLFVLGFLWAIRKQQWVPALWIVLTVLLAGFMLTGAPSSSHYAVSMPAICWLVAMPLGWLAEKGRWRDAIVLLAIVALTDLAFYFGVYVPGGPRDLFNPFPALPE